jgi:2-polyprenyl-6-methoxyphenol hydroxylase-like FAD-dependent oxidoreductase
MTTVGIVGAGIAGLHLALYLQQHGLVATLYADRSAAEIRAGRLPNTVALMGATRARDTALGTNHWDTPEHGTHGLDTHDPLTGQGANAASRGAFSLGELLVARARGGGQFDEAFCTSAEQHLRDDARAVTEWSNAFLQPPPPHAIGLLVAAARNQAVANAFADNFNHPKQQWAVLSSPDATAAFIGSFSAAQAS